jgi:glycosyltransferase involved in cell wall biosynthesis
MRIVLVLGCASRNAGGLFESVPGLARALMDCGVTVSSIGIYDSAFDTDKHRWPCPIQALPVSRWLPKKLLCAPGMLQRLMAEDPDMVFCHGLWSYHNRVVLQWARRTRRPYLIVPHGMLDIVDLKKSPFKKMIAGKWYMQQLFQGAACIRAISQSEADSIRAYGLRSPICRVPNGVAQPVACETEPPEWRKMLPTGSKVLFYIGRINPKKGLPALIEAWSQVANSKEASAGGWHLVIAGWDQDKHELTLKSEVQRHSLGKTVHFVGPLFDLAKDAAFRNSNAFILPSKSEGLPNVVLEAWAYNLPVLMTPQCNIPEGFVTQSALRIEADAESIAAGLRRLFLMNDVERNEMAANGRALVASKFSWKSVGNEMLAVCNWALGLAAKPASVLMTNGNID